MSSLVGVVATATWRVTTAMTATIQRSGSCDVFASPQLVALVEDACCRCVAKATMPHDTNAAIGSVECWDWTDAQGDRLSTVGTAMTMKHVAATPVGMLVTATATITHVKPNRSGDCLGSGAVFEFSAKVVDHIDESSSVRVDIGSATHTRVVVKKDRFLAAATAKLDKSNL